MRSKAAFWSCETRPASSFARSLQMIYNFKAALSALFRTLRPERVHLMTIRRISKVVCPLGCDDPGEYGRFTARPVETKLAETFSGAEELDFPGPDFEVIASMTAHKSGDGARLPL